MCSCLYGVFSIVMFFWLAAVIGSVVGSIPQLEIYLQECNPDACLRLRSDRDQIDCFASTLPWYKKPRFRRIPHLPPGCPQVFICCREGQSSPPPPDLIGRARALQHIDDPGVQPQLDELLNALS